MNFSRNVCDTSFSCDTGDVNCKIESAVLFKRRLILPPAVLRRIDGVNSIDDGQKA
jgi:hypothetical protein